MYAKILERIMKNARDVNTVLFFSDYNYKYLNYKGKIFYIVWILYEFVFCFCFFFKLYLKLKYFVKKFRFISQNSEAIFHENLSVSKNHKNVLPSKLLQKMLTFLGIIWKDKINWNKIILQQAQPNYKVTHLQCVYLVRSY